MLQKVAYVRLLGRKTSALIRPSFAMASDELLADGHSLVLDRLATAVTWRLPFIERAQVMALLCYPSIVFSLLILVVLLRRKFALKKVPTEHTAFFVIMISITVSYRNPTVTLPYPVERPVPADGDRLRHDPGARDQVVRLAGVVRGVDNAPVHRHVVLGPRRLR